MPLERECHAPWEAMLSPLQVNLMTINRPGFGSVTILPFLLGLGLGAGPAAAQVVLFEDESRPTMATGIRGLEVGGIAYDVVFKPRVLVAIYGDYPGQFTFTSQEDASDAVRAIVSALNNSPATVVGELGNSSTYAAFVIGYGSQLGAPPEQVEECLVAQGRRAPSTQVWEDWETAAVPYNSTLRAFPVFELAVSAEQSSWGALKAQYEN
jgi:hypothetical protein